MVAAAVAAGTAAALIRHGGWGRRMPAGTQGQDLEARHEAEQAAAQMHRLLVEAVENVASGFTIYAPDDRSQPIQLTVKSIGA